MGYSVSREEPDRARAGILGAWRGAFPHLGEERLDWIYVQNPAGPAIVWIARAQADDQVVGSAALLCRSFVVDGTTVRAGIAADFSVMEAHRGFGPALTLQRQVVRAVHEGDVAFAYGLPTLQAELVVRRAGFRRIGSVTQLTRPIKTRQLLARRTGSGVLAALLAPAVDLALRAAAVVRSSLRGSRGRFSGGELDDFDERFDELWRSVSTGRALLGDRSARFLRWRFGRSPHAEHRIFALTDDRTGALAGYVVYHTIENRSVVDDLLCRDLGAVLDRLLTEFARFRRREGADAIAIGFFGDPALTDGLRRNGYAVRDASKPVLLCVAPDSDCAKTVSVPTSWWLFPADNDV